MGSTQERRGPARKPHSTGLPRSPRSCDLSDGKPNQNPSARNTSVLSVPEMHVPRLSVHTNTQPIKTPPRRRIARKTEEKAPVMAAVRQVADISCQDISICSWHASYQCELRSDKRPRKLLLSSHFKHQNTLGHCVSTTCRGPTPMEQLI